MRQISMILGAIVVIGFSWCATSGPPLCIRWTSYDPVELGSRVDLSAGGLDYLYDCDRPQNAVVSWSSSDTSVAVVDRRGLVSTRREGKVRISAHVRRIWQGKDSAFRDLTVIPDVASLRLQPRDTVVSPMDSVEYRAHAFDANSRVIDVTPPITEHEDGFWTPERPKAIGRRHFRSRPTELGLSVWGAAPTSGWIVARIGEHRDSVRLTVR